MAVAIGASAAADRQRERAIERITELLEKLLDEKLEHERSELDGCRDAIDKATALLLDHGKVGASLGLDSAVHAIGKATQMAERRLGKWEAHLDRLGGGRVDVADLEEAFGGMFEEGGEFRAHLELAALAIALKRRVVVLQAVEAGQSDPEKPFENFVRSLRVDQQRIDDLEARIAKVLQRLSSLELRSSGGLLDMVMTRSQVDDLLQASYRLRAMRPDVAGMASTDVVIEIERHQDGTLLVLPARAA
jgi:prefoldin subunit 5